MVVKTFSWVIKSEGYLKDHYGYKGHVCTRSETHRSCLACYKDFSFLGLFSTDFNTTVGTEEERELRIGRYERVEDGVID